MKTLKSLLLITVLASGLVACEDGDLPVPHEPTTRQLTSGIDPVDIESVEVELYIESVQRDSELFADDNSCHREENLR